MPTSSDRTRQLGLALVFGLVLWAIWPVAALWSLLAAYLAAWLLLNVANAVPRYWPRLELTRAHAIAVALVVLAAPAILAVRNLPELLEAEGLRGVGEHVRDRLRLEAPLAIAPPVLFTDHPQSFYLNAPGKEELSVRFGEDAPELRALALGHGLFRLDYDPSRDGVPRSTSGSFEAEVRADGRAVRHTLTAIAPLAHPRWFASSPERGVAATASEETDEVFLVRRNGRVLRVEVGDAPTGCAFFDGGTRLAVSHRYDDRLWIVDVARGRVASKIPVGRFQTRVAAGPDGERLVVALDGLRPGLRVLSPAEGASVAVPLPFSPDWLVFGPDADTVVVSSLRERSLHRVSLGAEGWRVDASIDLVRPAVTLARSSDGQRVFAAVTDYSADGQIHLTSHFVRDQILTLDVASFQIVGLELLGRRSTGSFDRPGGIDSGASPMGIQARSDGSLLVALAGSDEVWLLPDASAAQPIVLARGLARLTAPHGVADLGEGVWAASSPSSGVVLVADASGRKGMAALAPSDEQLADDDPLGLLRRRGERGFYEATRSGISCQSCHAHGGTDHSVHNINQPTLLQTLTTRGLAGTAPYLRDASFPRVGDLLDVANRIYRGFQQRRPKRAAELEAYVEGLAMQVNPHLFGGPDPDRQREGLDAFAKANCTRCHSFPAFTNLAQHPAGSVFPSYAETLRFSKVFDVPSLRGLHSSAPFLHDGRAETLDAVFGEHNPENRHGNTEALSDREVEALVYLLETL